MTKVKDLHRPGAKARTTGRVYLRTCLQTLKKIQNPVSLIALAAMHRLRAHVVALALLTLGVRFGGLVMGFSALCDCRGAQAHDGSP